MDPLGRPAMSIFSYHAVPWRSEQNGCQPKNRGVYPQNGWFIMENPIKMDDLGVPLFLETPKCRKSQGVKMSEEIEESSI